MLSTPRATADCAIVLIPRSRTNTYRSPVCRSALWTTTSKPSANAAFAHITIVTPPASRGGSPLSHIVGMRIQVVASRARKTPRKELSTLPAAPATGGRDLACLLASLATPATLAHVTSATFWPRVCHIGHAWYASIVRSRLDIQTRCGLLSGERCIQPGSFRAAAWCMRHYHASCIGRRVHLEIFYLSLSLSPSSGTRLEDNGIFAYVGWKPRKADTSLILSFLAVLHRILVVFAGDLLVALVDQESANSIPSA